MAGLPESATRTGPASARDARKLRWLRPLIIAVGTTCVALLLLVVLNWWPEPDGGETRMLEPPRPVVDSDAAPPVSAQRQDHAPAPTAPQQPVAQAQSWSRYPPPAVIAALEAQGVHRELAEQAEVQRVPLAPQTTGYLGNSWNWLPELGKASSTLVTGESGQPTMLQLYGLAEDSVLHEIGIVDGDVLVLLDEQILEFGRRDLFDHSRRMRAALESLERGEPVSVTLLREGRPIHLVYQPW